MSMYYRVHSDRLVEELRNTVDDDEQLGISIYICIYVILIMKYYREFYQ